VVSVYIQCQADALCAASESACQQLALIVGATLCLLAAGSRCKLPCSRITFGLCSSSMLLTHELAMQLEPKLKVFE